MKNVKPQVGQVWEIQEDWCMLPEGYHFVIVESELPIIKDRSGVGFFKDSFLKLFKYVPATDLEWLACNRIVDSVPPHGYASAVKLGNNFIYQPDGTNGSHTLIEIQNMRYELGLDDRPKRKIYLGTNATISFNCSCVLTPQKETKMIDLSTAVVGDKFVLNNGNIVSFFARTKMSSICQLGNGHAMLYTHDGEFDEHVQQGDAGDNWNIKAKHDPRHWPKDLPDADLFSDKVNYIVCNTAGVWRVIGDRFADNINWVKNMPTLDKHQREDSKISIDELRAWQEQNK